MLFHKEMIFFEQDQIVFRCGRSACEEECAIHRVILISKDGTLFLSQYNNESILWKWRKRFLITWKYCRRRQKQRIFGQFVSTEYGNMALFISKSNFDKAKLFQEATFSVIIYLPELNIHKAKMAMEYSAGYFQC